MSSVIRGSDDFDSALGNSLRAWVNFNGTGTVAIRAAKNVSSIIDNGTGSYTVNFTNALPDANYAGLVTAGTTVTSVPVGMLGNSTFTPLASTTACRVGVVNAAGSLFDAEVVCASFFR